MSPSTPHSPEAALLALLRSWEGLSRDEAVAIASENWNALRAAQAAKAEVRARIEGIAARGHGTEFTADAEIRELAGRLHTQERLNLETLSRKLGVTRARLNLAEASTRNLQQVHSAYRTPTASGWQWYS
ncbi:MAG TPA: hypothetical protein DCM86_03380 [Verrucomicrobiales bacterium]|nr:hypothetical protein [Verrucomicrobiales bacterium]